MALPRSRTGIEGGRPGLRLLAVLAGLASLVGFCGCFESAEDETWFDIEADSALTRYSRVTVELQDSLGGPRATLFDDSLRSVNHLRRLPAGPYRGEAARIVLEGYRNGKSQYRETRHYEGVTQTVVAVEIFLGPFDSAATLDPAAPLRADAGEDTTVEAGTFIPLHARGDDRFGPIVTREWMAGSKPFAPVPQQETVHPAPSEPGTLTCILRVTDSDGLVDADTLLLTVIGRTSPP